MSKKGSSEKGRGRGGSRLVHKICYRGKDIGGWVIGTFPGMVYSLRGSRDTWGREGRKQKKNSKKKSTEGRKVGGGRRKRAPL